MWKLKNENLKQLEEAAKIFRETKHLKYFLYGDLGTGKTAFVKQFLRPTNVVSPTFTIYNSYINQNYLNGAYHYDLYRLGKKVTIGEMYKIDLMEHLFDNSLLFVEWAEKLPERYAGIHVYFQKGLIEYGCLGL